MKADFKKEFVEPSDCEFPVPQSVIDEINSSLPSCVQYKISTVTGKPEIVAIDDLKGKFEIEEEIIKTFPESVRNNRDLILDYLYRTQRHIEVINVRITDNQAQIPLASLGTDPLLEEKQNDMRYELFPFPFPELKPITLSYLDDDNTYTQTINIKRIPDESMSHTKIINSSFNAMKLVFIVPDQGEKDEKSSITFTVMPKCADCVYDIVKAMAFAKGFHSGKVIINGHELNRPSGEKLDIDTSDLNQRLTFWRQLYELESILSITISPKYEATMADKELYSELCWCMINKKPLIYKNPFQEFKVSCNDASVFKSDEWKSKSALSYMEEKTLSFMGNDILIYSVSVLIGFKVVDVIRINENDCSVQITNADDEDFVLYKTYTVKQEEAELFITEMLRKHEKSDHTTMSQ